MFWERSGKQNTDATVRIVLKKAAEENIHYLVVASISGKTVEKFIGNSLQLVCVTHQVNHKEPCIDEIVVEERERLAAKGIKFLTATHLFAGIDRSLRYQYGGIYPGEIVANTLRLFGEGLKVCVEIACMALDAGLIPYREKIISIGGTIRGADTALVITPEHSSYFFETKIHEIICKPQNN